MDLRKEIAKYAVVRKWKDGGEQVLEYFETEAAAKAWAFIQKSSEEYTLHLMKWE